MATGTTAQQTIDVVTPAAGESVTEGTILEWHVEGGRLHQGRRDDRRDLHRQGRLELPSPASGTVSEILVAEGDTVTVGQVIARIARGSAAARQPRPRRPAEPRAAGEPHRRQPAALAARRRTASGPHRWPARAAAVEGVDLASVPGTGPAGRITKADVLSTDRAAAHAAAPARPRRHGGAASGCGVNR